MKKSKIKKSTIYKLLKLFGYSKAPMRSIATTLILGISLGVAYEEMVGVGTWHSFHPSMDKVNVCFTPPSGCGGLIAQEISQAEHSIYVQAYGLTSKSIIYQLKAAQNRGVAVNVILDNGNLSNNKDVYRELDAAGINTYFDKMSGIAHNKVMIIDKHKVITGSFNFTKSADTRNAENVIIINDANVAEQYLQNWLKRKSKNESNRGKKYVK
jgi:phospholipase D